jgi:hypothetical protein
MIARTPALRVSFGPLITIQEEQSEMNHGVDLVLKGISD